MPILYYRADPNGMNHDVDDSDNPANIYDYRDNQMLLSRGVPGRPAQKNRRASKRTAHLIPITTPIAISRISRIVARAR